MYYTNLCNRSEASPSFSPDRGGNWLPVLPDREEKSCVSDVFFVVAIVAEKFKVIVVENNRDVGNVFGCDVLFVMNYVAIMLVATLAEPAVYRPSFGDERILTMLPFS